jgi:tetratricopeptide (TPR) repeat protein
VRTPFYILILTLGVCLTAPGSEAATAAATADSGWLDLESRIQYGYMTEDTRSLTNLTERLWSADSPDSFQSYYAALLAYRLSQVAAADTAVKAKWVERCLSSLDRAIDQRKDFADALALQSACLERLADLKPWRARFLEPHSLAQIRKALQLAPKNPRVMLLDAVGDYERSPSASGDRERAFAKFKKVVEAFENERQDVEHVPGWGAAEAYLFLARSYLDHGDAVAARDALERALLIAPEYVEAKRLMTRIISG